MQQLELKKSCIKPGDRTVKHEFLHALGVYHEHNRPDRHLHVDFHEEHLQHLDKAHNFNQKTLAHTHGDYDASSIMHYRSDAFAIEGRNTLTCKSGCKTEEMGGNELSRTDILGLLEMYPGFLNHLGGLEWGPRISTIDIAIGDITGDGQAEIITVRNADKEGLARIQIVESWNDWKNLRGKYDDGRGWGDGAIGLSVSVGNIDDDPELEFAVSRRQSVNMRAALYDYINDDPNLEPNRGEVKIAQTFGDTWPKNLHIRQVLFEDLDADQGDELILVTNAASLPSERTSEAATVGPLLVMKRNPASRQFEQVFDINGQLLPGTKVTRVSLGDTNRNGKLEFLVTTDAKKTGTPRFAIFEMPDTPEFGKSKKLTKVFEGGHGWGDENYATDISVSNPTPIAGQWIQPWIAISRRSFVNNRVSIYQFDPLAKDYIFKGKQGLKWGKNHYAHRVKFVDYDGDLDDDLIVIRRPRKNFNSEEDRLRFVENNSFRDPTLWREFGFGFYPLSNRQYITSLAIGDVEGNGSLELAVGNSAWDPLILSGGGGFGGKAPKPKTAASRRFGVLNLPDSP